MLNTLFNTPIIIRTYISTLNSNQIYCSSHNSPVIKFYYHAKITLPLKTHIPEGLFLRYRQSSSTVIPGGKPDLSPFLPAVARLGSDAELAFHTTLLLQLQNQFNYSDVRYRPTNIIVFTFMPLIGASSTPSLHAAAARIDTPIPSKHFFFSDGGAKDHNRTQCSGELNRFENNRRIPLHVE